MRCILTSLWSFHSIFSWPNSHLLQWSLLSQWKFQSLIVFHYHYHLIILFLNISSDGFLTISLSHPFYCLFAFALNNFSPISSLNFLSLASDHCSWKLCWVVINFTPLPQFMYICQDSHSLWLLYSLRQVNTNPRNYERYDSGPYWMIMSHYHTVCAKKLHHNRTYGYLTWCSFLMKTWSIVVEVGVLWRDLG